MILTFDYPKYKNILDRRLWSEINTSLSIDRRNPKISEAVIRVTIIKRNTLKYKTRSARYNLEHRSWRRSYFNLEELTNMVNIILSKYGFRFNVNEYVFTEEYKDRQCGIKLEVIPQEESK